MRVRQHLTMRCTVSLFQLVWVLVLAIFIFVSTSGKNICENKYRNIHPDHSMCKPRNDTCKFRGGVEKNAKQLLDLHNRIRKSIQQIVGKSYPEGKNMENMQWDHELHLIAEKHALQCTNRPDCSQCHQIDRFHVEQNFAVKTFSSVNQSFNGTIERFKMVIREWAQELRDYNPNIISRFHFIGLSTNWTNIFRATTSKIGCASVAYETQIEGHFSEVYVCNYGPATLTEDEIIYEQAYKNCSECANSSNCDVDSGLCKNQSLDEYESDISLSSRPLKEERRSDEQWWNRIKRETSANGDECPSKYQEITKEHSMCKPDKPACNFTRTYRAYKSRLLDAHNTIRNSINDYAGSHHRTATNMRVMEWDKELSEIARRYVIQCIEYPDCQLCHQTGDFPVEQNFAVKILKPTKWFKSGIRFGKVIEEWASELQQFTQHDVEQLSRETVESNKTNWTNIFRATTWKVGCASTSYETSSIPDEIVNEIYICNYSPAEPSKKRLRRYSPEEIQNWFSDTQPQDGTQYELTLNGRIGIAEMEDEMKNRMDAELLKEWNTIPFPSQKALFSPPSKGSIDPDLLYGFFPTAIPEARLQTGMMGPSFYDGFPSISKTISTPLHADPETSKLTVGEKLYEFGPSCSNCEEGFSCDSKYTNLCSRHIEQPLVLSYPKTTANQTPTITEVSNKGEDVSQPLIVTTPKITPVPTSTNINEHTLEENEMTVTKQSNKDFTEKQSTSNTPTTETEKQEMNMNNTNVPELPIKPRVAFPTTNNPSLYSVKNQASNSDIIWNCTLKFFNDETCRREQQCYKAWRISNDGNQPYMEIYIPEKTISGLLFLHNIYIERPSCFTFTYTKDVLNSWSPLTSSLYGIVVRTESNEHVMLELNDDISCWNPAALDIPWTKVFIQVGIGIKSHFGVGKQYIKIKDLVVHRGPCSAL